MKFPFDTRILKFALAGGAAAYAVQLFTTGYVGSGIGMVILAALLTVVQSWAANPADNEGLLVTMVQEGYAGLAFGTPTLQLMVVPEPGTVALMLCGAGWFLRRRFIR